MMSNRRQFMTGLGALTLGNFITGGNLLAANPLPPTATHFAPRAKRIIFLFMAGAPSQIETFDYKPGLDKLFDQDLPDSIRQGQRVTAMTKNQTRFPVVPSVYNFAQHGQSGAWVSELLPHTATMVDDLAIVRSVYTEAINHDPAKTLICTGNQLPGQASLGAWLSYALGSDNPDLPGFIVLNSATWSGKANVQALFSRLWGSGYLPTKHQGVTFRPNGDPVLYLSNPEGVSRAQRRTMLDLADALNRRHHQEIGDPEILTTIAQQDMAYRMQVSVPDLVDVSEEPEHVRALYGPQVDTPGTFAHNCLLARRMAERDVRCVQVFHRGWDHHRNLPTNIKGQSKDVDQASHGLIQDLKQRGLLDDTLVVWGGEFGRTVYCQGKLARADYGRDHHPRCFSMWLAGGGIKPGIVFGETDDFSYNVVRDPVHVRDLNATILHQLGFDHNRLTFPHQGLDAKLTGVEHAHVVKQILA